MKKTAIFLLSCAAITANAASFDCTKASSPTEKAICSSSDLSDLDSTMSQKYKNALLASQDPDALKANQRQWIVQTRSCSSAPEGIEFCLRRMYQERITYLRMAQENTAPANTAVQSKEVVTEQRPNEVQQVSSQPVQQADQPVQEKPVATVYKSTPSSTLAFVLAAAITAIFAFVPMLITKTRNT